MELQEADNPNVRKIVFVGLDNAGKTSIILSLLREISKIVLIKPTRNVERRTFEFLGMNISEWDLGGHERYRKLYLEKAESIFRRMDIVIYVVAIQDNDRIFESYIYLKSIIKKITRLELIRVLIIFLIFLVRHSGTKREKITQRKEKIYRDSRSMLLGLSFVDQIINSLNGEIWVTGSNFLIIIPEAM